MPVHCLCPLFLFFVFQLVRTSPHVSERDIDASSPAAQLFSEEEKPTTSSAQLFTSHEERNGLNPFAELSTTSSRESRLQYQTTADTLELQLPSSSEIAFSSSNDKILPYSVPDPRSVVTQVSSNESFQDKTSAAGSETTIGLQYGIGNTIDQTNSKKRITDSISKPQASTKGQDADAFATTNTAQSQWEKLSSSCTKCEGSFEPVLSENLLSTPAVPQKITIPSVTFKQTEKPAVAFAKSASTTPTLKTLSKNSTLAKAFTVPKSKVLLSNKSNHKNQYNLKNSAQNAENKKIYPLVRVKSGAKSVFAKSTAYNDSKDRMSCDGIVPEFQFVAKSGSYSVRNYSTSAWLSTSVITNNRILAELEARSKLKRYFDGDNEKGIRFKSSCPVLTQVRFKSPFGESREKVQEYAISFYLQWDGHTDLPSPNESEVLVDIMEELIVYVHQFEARIWEMTNIFLQSEARKLATELRRRGEPFLSKYFYVASYVSSPISGEYSKYEIWLYATRFKPHQITAVRQPPSMDQPLNEVTRRTRSRVCKGFECPSFEVLAVHKVGIQKRRYYEARFATYVPQFCSFTKAAIWRAFMPLHLYKHGVNSHFETIGATRPAGIVHVKELIGSLATNSTDSPCRQSFSVSLYLPKRLHAAPPVTGTTAPKIRITELNDVIVYVQSVGGFLLVPDRIQKEIGLFRMRLREQNLCYRDNEYYLVVYDYATRFHGRLNEIWVVADSCPDSL